VIIKNRGVDYYVPERNEISKVRPLRITKNKIDIRLQEPRV